MEIERNITYYDNKTENYIGEINIDTIAFEFLRVLFNPPEQDPKMYDVYEIDKEKAAILKTKLSIEFNFDKYDYFIECYHKE